MHFVVNPARRATLARLAHPAAVATAIMIGRAAESTPARLAAEYAIAAARDAVAQWADDAGWSDDDVRAIAGQGLELYLAGIAG